MYVTIVINKETRRRAFIAPDAIAFIREGDKGGCVIGLREEGYLTVADSFDDVKSMLDGLLEDDEP